MFFYNFVNYCGMLTDKGRLDAYVKALKDTINEDSIVLDLGAGTGIFTVLACDFGAKKVYSVEVNPLIKLLGDVLKDKGYDSRVEIIQKLSTDIELDEKANLMVSDIHGGFPLFESSTETILDARDRLLTEDAILIPRKETIYFAVSNSEKIYDAQVTTYLQEFHGFSIPSAERLVFNRWTSAMSKDEKLITDPAVFCEMEYASLDETSFQQEFEWTVNEDGTAHGLRGWFENELSDNNGVSNSIEIEDSTYSRPYFPLQKPVDLKKGDLVCALVSAKYEKGDYAWSWKTDFYEQGDKNKHITGYNQSVLASMFIEPEVVLKQSEYFVPNLNENAEIDMFILNSVDGEAMHGDIADAILEKFPKKFKKFEDALAYVAGLSQRYSK